MKKWQKGRSERGKEFWRYDNVVTRPLEKNEVDEKKAKCKPTTLSSVLGEEVESCDEDEAGGQPEVEGSDEGSEKMGEENEDERYECDKGAPKLKGPAIFGE